MEAIRSINIRSKSGTIITVPKDEVWKVTSTYVGSEKHDVDNDNFRRPSALTDLLLGGGTRIRLGTNDMDGVITGLAFKL